MTQRGLYFAICLFVSSSCLYAQSAVDRLEKDLDAIKAEHEQSASQLQAQVVSQLTDAASSPQAALDLYQKAGGKMPPGAPVQTRYDHETPDEKDARDAIDQARVANLAAVVQLHCGLMRFAVLTMSKTDPKDIKDVHDSMNTWFKAAAKLYPMIKDGVPDTRTPPKQQQGNGRWQGQNGGGEDNQAGIFKQVALRNSVISNYLGFHGWGESGQGEWSVSQLSKLYRSEVLEPLRLTPSPDTLAAWDTFIAMTRADHSDSEKWARLEYPGIVFDRACDDYAIAPNADKLQTLVEIIKANPGYPQIDGLIGRARQMMHDFKATHGGLAAAPTPDPTGATDTSAPSPNVSVTTSTQGDMTIITTHTNAAPVAPAQ